MPNLLVLLLVIFGLPVYAHVVIRRGWPVGRWLLYGVVYVCWYALWGAVVWWGLYGLWGLLRVPQTWGDLCLWVFQLVWSLSFVGYGALFLIGPVFTLRQERLWRAGGV
jgi:hypothetical protein